MELFQELKDLMVKRRKGSYRKGGDLFNELIHNISGLKRQLRDLWYDPQTSLVKCPACHGVGSFGDGWNEKILDCSRCFGLGFVDQKTRMKYIRSFIGMEEELRERICTRNPRD